MTRYRVLGFCAAVVFVLVASADVLGQARPAWYKPYVDGLAAVKDERWDDVIRLMNDAIRADGVQAAAKREDGVYTRPYYPFVYRGLAYLKKNDLDNAQKDFTRAWQDAAGFPRGVVAEFNGYKREFDAELARRKPTPPPPPPPPPDDAGRGPTRGPPPGPSQFERDAQAAQGLLERRQWADAARQFNELRQRNQAEFTRLGLGPKQQQALKGQSDALIAEGREALTTGKIPDARRKFEEADQVLPGSGAPGLRETMTREQDYLKAVTDAKAAQATDASRAIQLFERARTLYPTQFATEDHGSTLEGLKRRLANEAAGIENRKESTRLLTEGKLAATAKRFAEADAKYQQALTKDPNNADAKNLLDQSRQFGEASAEAKRFRQQNNLASANGPVRSAQRIDPARFAADSDLVQLLKDIERLVTGSDALRSGLVACLQGKWKEAVGTLSVLAEKPQGLDPGQRAHAYAYLAVSHATGALMATSPDEGEKHRKEALAQFGKARQLQPGYQLSETMVSPRIRQLLEAAR